MRHWGNSKKPRRKYRRGSNADGYGPTGQGSVDQQLLAQRLNAEAVLLGSAASPFGLKGHLLSHGDRHGSASV